MTKSSYKFLKWWSVAGALALFPGCDSPPNQDESIEMGQEALTAGALPTRISVMPVFLVPKGQPSPSSADKNKLRDHLLWTQKRYKEMLKGRDTFQIAGSPVVISDSNDATYWQTVDAGAPLKAAALDAAGI